MCESVAIEVPTHSTSREGVADAVGSGDDDREHSLACLPREAVSAHRASV